MLYALGVLSLAACVLFTLAAGAAGNVLGDPKVKAANIPVSGKVVYYLVKGTAVICEKIGQVLGFALQFKVVPMLLASAQAGASGTTGTPGPAPQTKADDPAVAALGDSVRRRKMVKPVSESQGSTPA